jgi:hypothetical protein
MDASMISQMKALEDGAPSTATGSTETASDA